MDIPTADNEFEPHLSMMIAVFCKWLPVAHPEVPEARNPELMAELAVALRDPLLEAMLDRDFERYGTAIYFDTAGVKVGSYCNGPAVFDKVKAETKGGSLSVFGSGKPFRIDPIADTLVGEGVEVRGVNYYHLEGSRWLHTGLVGKDVGAVLESLRGNTHTGCMEECGEGSTRERLAARAAKIWRELLEVPKYRNVREEDMEFSHFLSGIMASTIRKNNTPDVLDRFERALADMIVTCDDKWEYQNLSTDYGPCRMLADAAERAGLDMQFPWKTDVRIEEEDGCISVQDGYGRERVYHWLIDDRWMTASVSGPVEEVRKYAAMLQGDAVDFDIIDSDNWEIPGRKEEQCRS